MAVLLVGSGAESEDCCREFFGCGPSVYSDVKDARRDGELATARLVVVEGNGASDIVRELRDDELYTGLLVVCDGQSDTRMGTVAAKLMGHDTNPEDVISPKDADFVASELTPEHLEALHALTEVELTLFEFNLDNLLEMFEDSMEDVLELLRELFQGFRNVIHSALFDTACVARQNAHKFKGSCTTLGMHMLGDKAQDLIDAIDATEGVEAATMSLWGTRVAIQWPRP